MMNFILKLLYCRAEAIAIKKYSAILFPVLLLFLTAVLINISCASADINKDHGNSDRQSAPAGNPALDKEEDSELKDSRADSTEDPFDENDHDTDLNFSPENEPAENENMLKNESADFASKKDALEIETEFDDTDGPVTAALKQDEAQSGADDENAMPDPDADDNLISEEEEQKRLQELAEAERIQKEKEELERLRLLKEQEEKEKREREERLNRNDPERNMFFRKEVKNELGSIMHVTAPPGSQVYILKNNNFMKYYGGVDLKEVRSEHAFSVPEDSLDITEILQKSKGSFVIAVQYAKSSKSGVKSNLLLAETKSPARKIIRILNIYSDGRDLLLVDGEDKKNIKLFYRWSVDRIILDR